MTLTIHPSFLGFESLILPPLPKTLQMLFLHPGVFYLPIYRLNFYSSLKSQLTYHFFREVFLTYLMDQFSLLAYI